MARQVGSLPATKWKADQRKFLGALPSEILQLMIRYLSNNDKYHLGLTSRRFSALAIPALYERCLFTFVRVAGEGDVWAAVIPRGRRIAGFQQYINHGKHVRYVELRNVPETSDGGAGAAIQQDDKGRFDLLLPKFTGLKRFQIAKYFAATGPPLKAYMVALRQVLTTSMLLTSVCMKFHYSDEDLSGLSAFKRELALKPSVPQPRLLGLGIDLTQSRYNNDLKPTYNVLSLISQIVNTSARTVRLLTFGVDVFDFHQDFDTKLYAKSEWPLIENHGGRALDLPDLQALQLDLAETTLTEKLFLDFFRPDFAKIRQMEAVNMRLEPDYVEERDVVATDHRPPLNP
ncbi:hypothetical protein TWF481_006904 [Arthrobotrys musiformis]|uniref:F-box domain-containing protein n=1 Tax=Arthrobotrys musiformis TaxID=47236 RepID=A0AAV9WBT4_9PEZI